MQQGKAKDGKKIIVPNSILWREVSSKEYCAVDPKGPVNTNGELRAQRVFKTEEEANAFIKDNPKLQIEARDRKAIFITDKIPSRDHMPTAADGRPYRIGPDEPSLREFTWVAKDDKGNPVFYKGDVLIHPDYFDNLSKALTPSAIRKTAIGRNILNTAAIAKQTMLSISLFHPVQLAIHAIGHTVDIFHLKDIVIDNPNHPNYAIQRRAVEAGMTLGFHDAMRSVSEGVIGGGLIDRIPGIGPLSMKLGEYTFQDLLPRLKMSMFMDAFERNQKRYGNKLTTDQIASKTADEANAAFGGMNWRKMGVSQTMQDTLRLMLLAPDFLIARGIFAGQSLKGNQHIEQTAAMFRLALGMYVTARVANQLLDNNPHFDRPFSVIVNDQEFTLRSVPGDIMHAVLDPRSFIYHRLNPTLTRTMVESLTGRDMYGKERDAAAQFKDLIVTHIPIPFQGPFRKGDQQLWESAMSSAGVSTYKYKTDAEREASRLVSLNVPSKQLEAEEEAIVNAKAKMKDAIRNNKAVDPEIMKEIEKLSPMQARKVWMDATRYTSFEDKLNRLNVRETIKVFNKTERPFSVDEKERLIAAQTLAKKYINAVKHSPDQVNVLTDGEKADLQRAMSLLGQ
jgi:hypothetical protein